MIPTLIEVLGVLFEPQNLLLLFIATWFGLIMGAIPGLGALVGIAILIPLTFGMDPLIAFMIFAAINGGGAFGGSLSAILINTPGTTPNAATLLDGYPLSRSGRAGEAIGASATASALGAIVGIIVLFLSLPFLLQIVLAFGIPEVFWMGIWGLTVIAVITKGSVKTGLISAGLGAIFAMHGVNSLTATARWTYGLSFMRDGFVVVPALIGLFALPEMIRLISSGAEIAQEGERVKGGRWKGVKSVFIHRKVFLRSALIGTLLGIVPAVGGSVATFVSYFQAVQYADNPDKFGNGDIRGVIAAEAANDAKDGGAYIPTLGLGIPGSSIMAVILGAFVFHGMAPGPFLLRDNLDVVLMILVAALFSNIITSGTGLVFANKITKVTKMDPRIIGAVVITITFIASYASSNNVYHMYIALIFGLIGFILIKLGVSRIPLILGLILTPIIEDNFSRSVAISGGDYSIFVRSPISIFLIFLIILSLIIPYLDSIRYMIQRRFA